jgi:hypothetical protein
MRADERDPPAQRYEFRVRGHLGETMLGAFDALESEKRTEEYTLLKGELPDQAALHGVLAQIEALGIELLEVRRAAEC